MLLRSGVLTLTIPDLKLMVGTHSGSQECRRYCGKQELFMLYFDWVLPAYAPELFRGHVIFFFKCFIEMRRILETAIEADLTNIKFGSKQEGTGILQPLVI